MNFIKTNKEWLKKHTSYKDHYQSSVKFGNKQALESLKNNNNAKLQNPANLRGELQQVQQDAKQLQMKNSLFQEEVKNVNQQAQAPIWQANNLAANNMQYFAGGIAPTCKFIHQGKKANEGYFNPKKGETVLRLIGANDTHAHNPGHGGSGQMSGYGLGKSGGIGFVPVQTTQRYCLFDNQELFADNITLFALAKQYLADGGDAIEVPMFNKDSYDWKHGNIKKEFLTAEEVDYIEAGGSLPNLGTGLAVGYSPKQLAEVRQFWLAASKYLEDYAKTLPRTTKAKAEEAIKLYKRRLLQKSQISIGGKGYDNGKPSLLHINQHISNLLGSIYDANQVQLDTLNDLKKGMSLIPSVHGKTLPSNNTSKNIVRLTKEINGYQNDVWIGDGAAPEPLDSNLKKSVSLNTKNPSQHSPLINNFVKDSVEANTQPAAANHQSSNQVFKLNLKELPADNRDFRSASALQIDEGRPSARSMLPKTTAYKLPQFFQDAINKQINAKRSRSKTSEQEEQEFPSLVASKPNLDLEDKNIKTLQDTKVSNYDKYHLLKHADGTGNIPQIFTTKLEFKIAESDKHKGKIRISVGYEASDKNTAQVQGLIDALKEAGVVANKADNSNYANCIYIKPDDLTIAWQTLSAKTEYQAYPANHDETIKKFSTLGLNSECITSNIHRSQSVTCRA